jgi:cysteine desulfurase
MINKKNTKRIYLDHAASTPIDQGVVKLMSHAFLDYFGNPSSISKEGVEAKKILERCRSKVSEILGTRPKHIVFTGGATEADTLAFLGVINQYKKEFKIKPHVIVSAIEHSAIYDLASSLYVDGEIDLTILSVDSTGLINPKDLRDKINSHTAFVSVHYANNEIGTIEPIREIAKEIRHYKRHNNPNSNYPVFHTDASQAPNYLDLKVDPLGVDLMTLSSSKIYGPKGVGALYVKQGINLVPLYVGGNQEFGIRAGTENVPLVLGFTRALEISEKLKVRESKRLLVLKKYFISKLKNIGTEVVMNNGLENTLPNIVNFTLSQFRSEVIVLYLDSGGISVGLRSACKSTDEEVSHVLKAIGKDENILGEIGSIRVSMGRSTTKANIDLLIKKLKNTIKILSDK